MSLRSISIFVIFVAISVGFPHLASATEMHQVLHIVDGDTIDIDYNGTKERIRLLCVNTLESVHPDRKQNTPMGRVASDYTKKRLQEKMSASSWKISCGATMAGFWPTSSSTAKVSILNCFGKDCHRITRNMVEMKNMIESFEEPRKPRGIRR